MHVKRTFSVRWYVLFKPRPQKVKFFIKRVVGKYRTCLSDMLVNIGKYRMSLSDNTLEKKLDFLVSCSRGVLWRTIVKGSCGEAGSVCRGSGVVLRLGSQRLPWEAKIHISVIKVYADFSEWAGMVTKQCLARRRTRSIPKQKPNHHFQFQIHLTWN